MKGGRELVASRRTLEPDAYVAFGRCSTWEKERAVVGPAPHNWLGHITGASSAAENGKPRTSDVSRTDSGEIGTVCILGAGAIQGSEHPCPRGWRLDPNSPTISIATRCHKSLM